MKQITGAPLDIIFDATGFADLAQATYVDLPDIGRVPVASPLDVAYSKLRTQRSDWKRRPDKRMVDLSDLIALLRENPSILPELYKRVQPRPYYYPDRDVYDETMDVLMKASRDAGLRFPEVPFAVRFKYWKHILAILVLAVIILLSLMTLA